ncbi:hypothetical protein JTB14_015416 [Gonioctena quinquepunctata]|nr:hypothetical protein JTB14_015416 [Gonioctena quinquepunctata]
MMSSSQQGAPDVGCEKCKNVAESGLKCINCGVFSHVSCLKHLKNIIYINESSVKCCEMVLSEVGINENNHSDDLDLSFGSAIDNSSDSSKKEIHYLKIIRQKDKLIENQNFTLKALCDQIDLLKRSTNNKHFNQLSAQQVTSQGEKRNLVDIPETIGECPASSTKPAHSAILKNPIVSDKGKAIAVSSVPVVTTLPNCSSLPRNSRISKKDVSAAIHQANSESKCREIIQMGSKEDALGLILGFTLGKNVATLISPKKELFLEIFVGEKIKKLGDFQTLVEGNFGELWGKAAARMGKFQIQVGGNFCELRREVIWSSRSVFRKLVPLEECFVAVARRKQLREEQMAPKDEKLVIVRIDS